MPRNPSELARLEAELAHVKGCLRAGLYRDKDTKQYWLNEITSLARQLGEHVPEYNSSEFSEWLRK